MKPLRSDLEIYLPSVCGPLPFSPLFVGITLSQPLNLYTTLRFQGSDLSHL
jgi:hypothetical protein